MRTFTEQQINKIDSLLAAATEDSYEEGYLKGLSEAHDFVTGEMSDSDLEEILRGFEGV
jgi:hypothetical protein